MYIIYLIGRGKCCYNSNKMYKLRKLLLTYEFNIYYTLNPIYYYQSILQLKLLNEKSTHFNICGVIIIKGGFLHIFRKSQEFQRFLEYFDPKEFSEAVR